MTNKKIKYSEPAEYFPKEVREKYKLGEYAEKENKELEEDCGGLRPYNSIKPPKDRDAKRTVKSTKNIKKNYLI